MIPKIIHHVWVGPVEIPAAVRRCMGTWKAFHPDWEHRLWTNDNLPEMHKAGIYEHSVMVAQKADILRQEVLLQFGGIYVDIDFECLKSFEPILELTDYFYGDELPGIPNIAIMGAAKDHPLTRHCVRTLSRSWPWRGDVGAETGPTFYKTAILEYLGEHASVLATDPLSGRDLGYTLIPKSGAPSLLAFYPWVVYPYYGFRPRRSGARGTTGRSHPGCRAPSLRHESRRPCRSTSSPGFAS